MAGGSAYRVRVSYKDGTGPQWSPGLMAGGSPTS